MYGWKMMIYKKSKLILNTITMVKLKKSDLKGKSKPELRKIAKERDVKFNSKEKTVSKMIDKILKDQQPLKKKTKNLTKAQVMDKGFRPLNPEVTSNSWYKIEERKAKTLGGPPTHMKKPCKESNDRKTNIINRGLMVKIHKLRKTWKLKQQPPSKRDTKHDHILNLYKKGIDNCNKILK